MTIGSKVKQTLAELKGIESTLRLYSLQSKNEEDRIVYKKSLETAESVIKDLEYRIKIMEFEEPQYKGN
ncbi:DUF1657 domain-containing protein [Clostridium sp. JN-9]|uniref:DUF1657 domain-containing protein n=1 Tax=Clostridium sp. JN-9 TaxID=2507159 RepID=UPI000FFDFA72|nr:DUF1657 domain-containing protein [Clostridium sp. JN-9]QAT39921.1 DUF1657 domain-containing protein [Clostridium sp. JN-9]